MSEESAALYRRVIEDIIGRGDAASLEELVDEAYVDHNPLPRQRPGPTGFLDAAALFQSAFPDHRFAVEATIAAGDRVMGRWTLTGTHDGPLFGMPPTHRPVNVTGLDIVRIVDGKIVEKWTSWDTLGMMLQLGVFQQR